MLKLWSKILVFRGILLCSGAETSILYYVPSEPLRAPLSEPIKRIKLPREYKVWNLYSGGHADATTIEYKNIDGKWVRGATQRENIVPLYPGDEVGDCVMRLIRGGLTHSFERVALTETASGGYHPLGFDVGQIESYLDHNRPNNDLVVYFESATWMNANEIKEYFPDRFPWERVSNIETNENERIALELVKERAEKGEKGIRLRVRLGLVKLVSGQTRPSLFPGAPLAHVNLPWQTIGYERYLIDKQAIPFAYELSRAWQLPSTFKEMEGLLPLAASVAYQHSLLVQGSGPFPAEFSHVFIRSLDPGHNKLFERMTNARQVAWSNKVDTDRVLRTDLSSLFQAQTPSKSLYGLSKLRRVLGEDVPEEHLMAILYSFRVGFRHDLDVTWYEQDPVPLSNKLGPIVWRDYSPIRRHRLENALSIFTRGNRHKFEQIEEILGEVGQIDSPNQFGYFVNDFGQRDWKQTLGVSPFVISNIDSSYLTSVPDFLRLLLLKMYVMHIRLPESQITGQLMGIAAKNENVINQAKALGMKEYKTEDGVSLLTMPFEKVIELSTNNTAEELKKLRLARDYWDHYRVLVDLPGI